VQGKPLLIGKSEQKRGFLRSYHLFQDDDSNDVDEDNNNNNNNNNNIVNKN